MAKRLKNNLDELKVLKKAKPKLRKSFLEAADKDLICCIAECCHNILQGNVQLSPESKRRLKRHGNHLRQLASKRVSLRKKRSLLVQKGGFLPTLLVPILGVAASLISSLVRR